MTTPRDERKRDRDHDTTKPRRSPSFLRERLQELARPTSPTAPYTCFTCRLWLDLRSRVIALTPRACLAVDVRDVRMPRLFVCVAQHGVDVLRLERETKEHVHFLCELGTIGLLSLGVSLVNRRLEMNLTRRRKAYHAHYHLVGRHDRPLDVWDEVWTDTHNHRQPWRYEDPAPHQPYPMLARQYPQLERSTKGQVAGLLQRTLARNLREYARQTPVPHRWQLTICAGQPECAIVD